MYESFYHLRANPFRLTPDPEFCFSHPAYQESHAYLQYAFSLGEGFILLTGRPGAGKTTLVESFLRSLGVGEAVTARIAVTDFEACDLLRSVAYTFDIEAEGLDKATLLRRIEQFFVARVQSGRRVLLVIDEAQRLSHAALEELRLLADLQLGARPLLQIFLVGQEALRALMREPEMEQLQQRVIGTCRLGPLGARETRDYVQHRLCKAGWQGDPALTGAAVVAIYEYSKGVPRHINKICTRLLLQGYMEDRHLLDQEDVHRVAGELGEEQLAPLAAAAGGHDTAACATPESQEGIMPDPAELAVRAAVPAAGEALAVIPSQSTEVYAAGPDSVAAARPPARRRATPPRADLTRSRGGAGAMTYPGTVKPHRHPGNAPRDGHAVKAGLANASAAVRSLQDKPALLFSLVAAVTLSAGALTALVGGSGDTPNLSARASMIAEQSALLPEATLEGPRRGPVAETPALQATAVADANPDGAGYADPGYGLAVVEVAAEATRPDKQPSSVDALKQVDAASSPPSQQHLQVPTGQADGHKAADSGVPREPGATMATEDDTAAVQSLAAESPGDARTGVPAATLAKVAVPVAQRSAGLAPVVSEAREAPVTEPVGLLSELLLEAEVALAEDRLTIPSGNCAYGYYRQVLLVEPGNAHALKGIDRIVERYSVLAGHAVERGDTEKAARYIARGLRVRPGDERLQAMQINLDVVAAAPPAAATVPQALPPPLLEEPPPENFLQRLKALFAEPGPPSPASKSVSPAGVSQ